MRARKVISWSLVVFVVLLLAGAWLSYRAFKGTPDFYHRPQLTDAERADAFNAATQKIIRTRNWAQDVWRAEHGAQGRNGGDSVTTTTTHSAAAYTVAFSEREVNAYLDQVWINQRWDEKVGKYVKDATVTLRDGRIILAGKLVDLETVASFHFAPSIDEQGQFHLKVARVLAGRLPMPEVVWSSQRDRVVNALRQRLPEWQRNAEIARDGVANESAIAADASKMLLEMLDERSREPVLFLPFQSGQAVPVRLSAVGVADGELTFTVEPVTPAERAAMLERLRKARARGAGVGGIVTNAPHEGAAPAPRTRRSCAAKPAREAHPFLPARRSEFFSPSRNTRKLRR